MRVLLSWSGDVSRAAGSILRTYLPNALHPIKFWMSTEDMRAGLEWSSEISGALAETDAAVLCLTPDNLYSPWILFEAGAVSHAVGRGRVIPYLYGLGPADLTGPLSRFQAVRANEEGTWELFRAINDVGKFHRFSDADLRQVFDMWWPRIEVDLASIGTPAPVPRRSDRELLEEMLEILRRWVPSPTRPLDPSRHHPWWVPEDFHNLNEAQIDMFFERELVPWALVRAQREYHGIDGIEVSDIEALAMHSARKTAEDLGLVKRFDVWFAERQGA